MNQHTALTTVTRLPGVQSLLNSTQAEDAGSTGENSEYELFNAHSLSNEVGGSTASTRVTSGFPLSGSSLVNGSQAMNSPLPAIHDQRQRSRLKQHSNFSAKPPCQYDQLERTRQSMDSRPAIGVARGSPVPTSTVETSHSRPSMASPEAYICPPPTTTAWPQKTQWIQDSPTHLQSMQPYLGSPPSKDAAPLWQEDVHVGGTRNGWFGVEERQYYLALPGSEQVIPVPVDLTQASKNMNAKRKRNAAASVRHRKKKKVVEEENLKELRELRKEMKEWEMYTKEMEADRNYYRGIIKQIPELQHFVRPRNILSRTTNFAVTVDGLATKPQGSLDERQPERRRIDRVSGFYTPENRAFIESFSSSQTFELPLKQNPQNTSTNWLLP